MGKRDLHCHTTYSDGSLPPERVVALGAKMGIRTLGITDHDTMAGCGEAQEAGKIYNVEIIPGVEISAYDFMRNRRVHVLGYTVEDRDTLEKACRPFLQSRHDTQVKALEKILAAGYPLTKEEVLAYTGPLGFLYRQHVIHALVDRGFDTSIYGPLYQKLYGRDGLAFLQSEYMDVFTALELILDCGGTPVLAHPYQYDSIDLLPELVERGLKGLECRNSKHNSEQNAQLDKLAVKYGLEFFEGSDFHGFYGNMYNPLGNGCRE